MSVLLGMFRNELEHDLARIWHGIKCPGIGTGEKLDRKSGGNNRGSKSSFGSVRKLPSGKYQARYTAPNGKTLTAPVTFETLGTARKFLSLKESEIITNTWNPSAKHSNSTFGEFSQVWISQRDLKPRTFEHYGKILDKYLLPVFGSERLTSLSSDQIKDWYSSLGSNTPTLKAHTYGLLRTILNTAVEDGVIQANPCHIRGAGTSKRVIKIREASLEELEIIILEMPERLKVMTCLAAWCAMRFGELVELRRKDLEINLEADYGIIRIRRGATRASGKTILGSPKSVAGIRDVAIPPHLLPIVQSHLDNFVGSSPEALLFSGRDGKTLQPSSLYGALEYTDQKGRVHPGWGFYKARNVAGRDDLRWHDLRHTGAVYAAIEGATLAELMGRLGHSSAAAAMRYQHVAKGRDMELARKLSERAKAS